jgi:hypothetical protein
MNTLLGGSLLSSDTLDTLTVARAVVEWGIVHPVLWGIFVCYMVRRPLKVCVVPMLLMYYAPHTTSICAIHFMTTDQTYEAYSLSEAVNPIDPLVLEDHPIHGL